MIENLTLIASCLLAALIIYAWRRHQALPPPEMPAELVEASLWLAEKEIQCAQPVPLHGKPDQVFKLRNGLLVIVDVKTHARVYSSDVMQMSVYRVILIGMGYNVADYGYVRSITPSGQKFIKRTLLGTDTVVRAWHRHHGLMGGHLTPAPTAVAALCNGCGHRPNCQ